MTLSQLHVDDVRDLVDAEKGLVDRRIFNEQTIYELELERIFARAWNFMCHDSQIPNPGDFFMSFIGEDRVIVVRDNEGQPQVLINSCRHRGNAVCRAEEGHSTSFMCTYHGWTYDLQGRLVGVPGFKEVYHEELDRENWGLIRAAHVGTYKGFIFATMDPEAPSLETFLGPVGRMGLDYVAVRARGEGEELTVVPGVQKFTIDCNWKFAVDNVWDYYHASLTHASMMMAMRNARALPASQLPQTTAHLAVIGEYGHVIAGPRSDGPPGSNEAIPETPMEINNGADVLGPVGMKIRGHPHIFPNLWIGGQGWVMTVRFPKGPHKTEVWRFAIVRKGMTPERRRAQVRHAIGVQGPAGLAEQDDGENWSQSTRGMAGLISSRHPLHYAMNLGRGQVIEDEIGPPRIESQLTEHAQLWFYRSWADWMASPSWHELEQDHSRPGGSL